MNEEFRTTIDGVTYTVVVVVNDYFAVEKPNLDDVEDIQVWDGSDQICCFHPRQPKPGFQTVVYYKVLDVLGIHEVLENV